MKANKPAHIYKTEINYLGSKTKKNEKIVHYKGKIVH